MERIIIGSMLFAALFSVIACSNESTNTGRTKVEETENKSTNTIFPKDEQGPVENFTGTVYVQMLAPKTEK